MEPVRVPLNHCFRVLDSETYRAIEESEFLRTEFAPVETRTTVRMDRTYTGLYLYGRHTYFEFFDVARETMGSVGHSGLAFGVDEPGALKRVQAQLVLQPHIENRRLVAPHAPATRDERSADFGVPVNWLIRRNAAVVLAPAFPMQQTTITRQLGDQQIPWFLMMTPGNVAVGSSLSLWFMEYHPRFLAEWHPEAKPAEGEIRRDQILRRYVATLDEAPPHRILEDVVGLTIAVDPTTRLFLKELCQRLGYRTQAEGEATRLEGPDVALRLVPETAAVRGIQEMTLRVQRAPERCSKLHFGPASVLSFRDDGTAVWTF